MGERMRGRAGGMTVGMAGLAGVFGDRRAWSRDLLIAGLVGLFLGAVGPFGSYLNPSRVTVVAYWVGAVLLGEVIVGLTVRPAVALAPSWGMRPWMARVVATVLAAVPLSAGCRVLAMALWPAAIGPIGLKTWYLQTLVVAAGLTAGHAWAEARRDGRPAAAGAARAGDGDFLSRLPGYLGRDLVALQMEDHYLRAHTMLGSAMILIPLRQALAELGGLPGMQVHRSWWVARRAVIGSVHDGRNLRLRLVNGVMAPVARAKVAEARALGLL